MPIVKTIQLHTYHYQYTIHIDLQIQITFLGESRFLYSRNLKTFYFATIQKVGLAYPPLLNNGLNRFLFLVQLWGLRFILLLGRAIRQMALFAKIQTRLFCLLQLHCSYSAEWGISGRTFQVSLHYLVASSYQTMADPLYIDHIEKLGDQVEAPWDGYIFTWTSK